MAWTTARSVLLVDESATVSFQLREQAVLAAVLEGAGFVSMCTSGAEAPIRAAEARGFALIVVDVATHTGAGLAVIRAVRALPAHRETPIIVLTFNVDAIRSTARAAGATALLAKPYDPASLLRGVAHFNRCWDVPTVRRYLVAHHELHQPSPS